jgi:hypothetical protein
MGKELILTTKVATFTAGLLGGETSLSVMDTDSLLICLEMVRDASDEEHTVQNINAVINMIHRLKLRY